MKSNRAMFLVAMVENSSANASYATMLLSQFLRT